MAERVDVMVDGYKSVTVLDGLAMTPAVLLDRWSFTSVGLVKRRSSQALSFWL